MPYIEVKTTKKMNSNEKSVLSKRLADAFADASSSAVAKNIQMVIEDECWICFRGDTENGSVHVQICLGPLTPPEDYVKIIEKFFLVLVDELGIDKDHIYLNILELEHWGFDGNMVIVNKER